MSKKFPEVEIRFNCQEVITLGKVLEATDATLKLALADATLDEAPIEVILDITEHITALQGIRDTVHEAMETIHDECCPTCGDEKSEFSSELS